MSSHHHHASEYERKDNHHNRSLSAQSPVRGMQNVEQSNMNGYVQSSFLQEPIQVHIHPQSAANRAHQRGFVFELLHFVWESIQSIYHESRAFFETNIEPYVPNLFAGNRISLKMFDGCKTIALLLFTAVCCYYAFQIACYVLSSLISSLILMLHDFWPKAYVMVSYLVDLNSFSINPTPKQHAGKAEDTSMPSYFNYNTSNGYGTERYDVLFSNQQYGTWYFEGQRFESECTVDARHTMTSIQDKRNEISRQELDMKALDKNMRWWERLFYMVKKNKQLTDLEYSIKENHAFVTEMKAKFCQLMDSSKHAQSILYSVDQECYDSIVYNTVDADWNKYIEMIGKVKSKCKRKKHV
eukprot:169705_1